MSVLLFIIGGIAVMVGAATVAFGIPINEFSFGNTLIVAGTPIGTGGLIIIAIVVGMLVVLRLLAGGRGFAGFGGAYDSVRRCEIWHSKLPLDRGREPGLPYY